MAKMNWTKVRQENLISRRGGVEKIDYTEFKTSAKQCTSHTRGGQPCRGMAKRGFDKCGPHLDVQTAITTLDVVNSGNWPGS